MNDASNYSLKDCEVPPERRPALEAYRAKRRTWLDWIDKDEDHAIWTTLSKALPDPQYFDDVWVVGLYGVENGDYDYGAIQLVLNGGNAPAYTVRIKPTLLGG